MPVNEDAANPSPQQLQEQLQEIGEIFKQARRGLTEESAAAALVLKREIAIHQALLGLLLDGEMVAKVIDESKTLTVSNFIFTPWPPDEPPSMLHNVSEPCDTDVMRLRVLRSPLRPALWP